MSDQKSFIKTRLDCLNTIDTKVVSLLDQMSGIFDKYSTPGDNSDSSKDSIETQTRTIYQTISDIAISLRKEVKIMDDNIGVFDRNEDNVMILPIQVEQKTTGLGKRRLKDEITQLKELIPEEPSEDQKFIVKEQEKDQSDAMDISEQNIEPETSEQATSEPVTSPKDRETEAEATEAKEADIKKETPGETAGEAEEIADDIIEIDDQNSPKDETDIKKDPEDVEMID